jgi:hypothetical protein
MSEETIDFAPVATLDDLCSLDDEEIIAGYREFRPDDPEPGPNRGRAYWHGWMNAARDRGIRPLTAESRQLAYEYLRRRK